MKDIPIRIIRAIVFDFDGTLTRPGSLDFQQLREELASPVGAPILEYIQGLPRDRRRYCLRVLDRFEMEGAARSRPNEGAEALIRDLQAMRLPLAVVSRNCRAAVVRALVSDEPLEQRHRDHALSGPWADFRDCHIRPDLVLIYEKRTHTRSGSFAWDRTPNSDSDALSAVGVPVPT